MTTGNGGGGKTDGPLGKAPDMAVGASDRLLLGISVLGFGVMAYLVYNIILSKVKSAREMRDEERNITFEEKLARADVSTLNRAQRRARARHIAKQQKRIGTIGGLDDFLLMDGEEDDDNHHANMPMGDAQEPLQPEEEDVPPFEEDTHHNTSLRHLSRKERQKAAKQIELQERKVLEDQRRKEQEEIQQEERQKKQERERQKASQLEADRKLRQEQRAAEEMAAYHAWRIFLPRPKERASTEKELPKGYVTVKEWKAILAKDPVFDIPAWSRRTWISKEVVRERISELLETDRITGYLKGDRFTFLSRDDLVAISTSLKRQDKFDSKNVQAEVQRLIEAKR